LGDVDEKKGKKEKKEKKDKKEKKEKEEKREKKEKTSCAKRRRKQDSDSAHRRAQGLQEIRPVARPWPDLRGFCINALTVLLLRKVGRQVGFWSIKNRRYLGSGRPRGHQVFNAWFLVDQKSSIFGVWAAPGAPETIPKGGGPPFGMVSEAPGPPEPQISTILDRPQSHVFNSTQVRWWALS